MSLGQSGKPVGVRSRATGCLTMLAAVGAAAVLVAGCGGSSGSGQAPTVSLSRAADVSTAASGYKVAMTMRETLPNLGAINATGSGSFSPAAHQGALAMQMTLPTSAGTGALPLQIVLNKTTVYVKLPPQLASRIPGQKPWLYVNLSQAGQAAGIPGLGSLVGSSTSLTDPGEYLNFLRATSAGSVKDLGQATVNGVRTTHYRAEVNLAKLPDTVPSAERQSMQQLVAALRSKGAATEIPMDAWIDSAHLIRRVQSSFSETISGQPVDIALTEDFLQYGPQPAPAIPSPSQTTNILSLAGGGSSNSSSS
jgi:hypothetical protein